MSLFLLLDDDFVFPDEILKLSISSKEIVLSFFVVSIFLVLLILSKIFQDVLVEHFEEVVAVMVAAEAVDEVAEEHIQIV